MYTPTRNTQCCATCVHWRGVRNIKPNCVEVGSSSQRGECGKKVFSGVIGGICAYQGTYCKEYSKL